MSEYDTILVEERDAVTLVTLNRPQALNALNTAVLEDLIAAFTAFEADDRQRCAVLTGSGEKAFAAGADIKEMADKPMADFYREDFFARWTSDFTNKIRKPWIAAVNGFALGGGCELALACDFIYASENAKFGLPEVSLGVIPGFGGTQRLTRLLGRGRAKELIFTGDMIDAAKAREIGLVMEVVPLARLVGHARAALERVAKKGPLAVRRAKEGIDRGADLELADGLTIERELFSDLFNSSDRREGMKAFLEKRPPAFTGR